MLNVKKVLFVALLFALAACSSLEESPQLETMGGTKKATVKVYYDAEERRSGEMDIKSSDLELAYDGGAQTVGLQFDGLNVPQGAKVTNAYVQFKADESDRGGVKLRLRAEATDNADIYRGNKRNISSRKITSAEVTWRPKSWKRGERSKEQRTPDLTPLVQEIVSRPGWRSGNALGVVITSSDRSKRVAESSNGDRANRPMLVVEYQTDSAAPPSRPVTPAQPAQPITEGSGVPIILDTDFGFDVDDVGALAVLHALADNGEADILAVVSVVTDPHSPGAVDAINTYYNRPDLLIGQNDYAPRHYRWDRAYPYWRNAPRFVKNLDEEFSNDTSANVPSAVSTYRKVLATQPDKSVTIVVVGFMKNMADLLKSGPDRYSNLSGKALAQRKVKKLVVMGGSYPGKDTDFNLTNGPARTAQDGQYVIEKWPTELVFTGGELCNDVITGQTLKRHDSRKNPVARAYRLFSKSSRRNSWDLCSVLYAVRGNEHDGATYFSSDSSKRLVLRDNLDHYWKAGGRSNQKRLKLETSRKTLEKTLEQLLTQPPK